MKRALPALVVLVLGAMSLSFGVEDAVQIQIALYPYYHDPEVAWRVTIHKDGIVRYEESTVPVKVSMVTPEDATQWVERSGPFPKHLSPRKRRSLLTHLSVLGLGNLRPHYSAQFSFTDPTALTQVTTTSGESHTEPVEVTRLITHGATYRLRVILDHESVDSSVYAPFEAMQRQTPVHPDRAAIANIVAAWYYALKAIGPVNEFKAKMFRSGIE